MIKWKQYLDYNEGENKMILKYTKQIDFNEVECILELNKNEYLNLKMIY